MGVDRNDPQVEALTRSDIPRMAIDQDFGGGRTGYVSSMLLGSVQAFFLKLIL